METKKYIYESPDGGKTIYRREFMNYKEKTLIKQETGKVPMEGDKTVYIYESPDGGKTIYRREFMKERRPPEDNPLLYSGLAGNHTSVNFALWREM